MSDLPHEPAKIRSRGERVARLLWLALGFFCVALGIIGAFLPLMPTTIFLILAAGCFGRSSSRLERWLLEHPRFGASLRAWRRDRAIPRRAKGMACLGMAVGFVLFLLGAHPGWAVIAGVAISLMICAAWIVSRPAPPAGAQRSPDPSSQP